MKEKVFKKRNRRVISGVVALSMTAFMMQSFAPKAFAYGWSEECQICHHRAAEHIMDGNSDDSIVQDCMECHQEGECECREMTWDECKNATPRPSSGTFAGTDISWTFDGDTLTISGTGAMPDVRDDRAFSGKKDGSVGEAITKVVIESGITSIGGSAFSGLDNLTSVTIPGGVTSINDYAFNGCSGLTSVTINGNVSSFGQGVFFGCSRLTSITIPDGATSLGKYMFKNCSALENVTIPSSVTFIDDQAFSACRNLKSVTVKATTPPVLGTDVFYCWPDDYPSGLEISVSSASEAAYKTAWSAYASTIQGNAAIETNATNTYTLTIPSTATASDSGFNAIGEIEISDGDIADTKKIVITPEGSEFKNTDTSITTTIGYTVEVATDNGSTPITNGLTVSAAEANAGYSKEVGLNINEQQYDAAEDGEYETSITWTAKIVNN